MTRSLGGFFFIALLGTNLIAALPQYHLTDLGVLYGSASDPYNFSYSSAINDQGTVAGYSYLTQFPAIGYGHRPFAYGSGTLSALPLPGDNEGYAYGVNNQNQIVGANETLQRAMLWNNGVAMDLGFAGSARAINDSGKIVGQGTTSAGPNRPFAYSNGVLTDLGSLGAGGIANAINAQGQIVGAASLSNGEVHAFVHENGSLRDLDVYGWSWSRATGINDLGQIVGYAMAENPMPDPNVDSFYTDAFVISGGVMTKLGNPGWLSTAALGINNHGQIVGGFEPTPYTSGAFIYSDGVMTDLRTLLDSSSSGWYLSPAADINDAGWIVTSGNYPGFTGTHAVLLTPVPEPSGVWAMLVSALAVLIARRRDPKQLKVTGTLSASIHVHPRAPAIPVPRSRSSDR